MKLIIEDDEGRKTVVPLVREEITIGRQDGNTIRLTERNVSRRHARLVKENGNVVIEDLGSYNGVRVNGEKITGPTKIKEGDLVEIGDYDLGIQGKLDAVEPAAKKQTTIPPGSVKAAARTTIPPTQAAAPAQQEKPAPPPQSTTPSPSAGGATAIIRVSDVMKGAPQGEVRDLDRGEMPRLVGLAGPFRAKEFYLMRSEVKFGRTEENDIVAEHQSVSRQHCKFVLDQGQWKVIDNKSANGVRVNGEEYAVSNVQPGDVVELGHLKFRFCAPGEKFTAPPEKAEGEQQKGMKPTTAELIAGASQPGRMGTAKKGRSPALGVALGVAAIAVAIGAVMFLRRGARKEGSGQLSAAEATREGDAAFKRHEYGKASELYEQAVAEGVTPPNRKRAIEEAKGERTYNQLRDAIAADPDKAKALFDKCASDSGHYCQKVQSEFADQVKSTYSKKHLNAATAAKSAGKAEACSSEVNLVLAMDPANAEAQAIQCAPQAAAERHEGPSPAERNAKASKLGNEAFQKLVARDLDGAYQKANDALKQGAPDKKANAQAWRVLGYVYATARSDPATGKKYLEKYLPYCTDDCDKVKAFVSR